MSHAQIVESALGCLQLSGVVDYQSGPALREQGARLIAASSTPLTLDCAQVTHASSVGLALLLAFMRDARAAGRTLTITGLPDELHQVANVSGLLDILPLSA